MNGGMEGRAWSGCKYGFPLNVEGSRAYFSFDISLEASIVISIDSWMRIAILNRKN